MPLPADPRDVFAHLGTACQGPHKRPQNAVRAHPNVGSLRAPWGSPGALDDLISEREAVSVYSRQLAAIQHSLEHLHRKVDTIMATQQDLDQAVADIEAKVGALTTAADAIKAEIASLQQQNPALDLTGLTQAVADLDTAAAAVSAIPPAPPAPAS